MGERGERVISESATNDQGRRRTRRTRRAAATKGGGNGRGTSKGTSSIAVQGCYDPAGSGTPRLSDFPSACRRLASGYALGLVHGQKYNIQ